MLENCLHNTTYWENKALTYWQKIKSVICGCAHLQSQHLGPRQKQPDLQVSLSNTLGYTVKLSQNINNNNDNNNNHNSHRHTEVYILKLLLKLIN